MTSGPNHPGSSVPPPREDVMLAWVEGLLSPEIETRLTDAHPAHARQVAGLRRDRDALRSLAIQALPSPPDMADRVIAQLEREALLGLSEGDRVAPIAEPRLTHGPARARRVAGRRASPWAPRLAMAAGFVLLAGVGAFWVRSVIGPGLKDTRVAKRGERVESASALAIADRAPSPAGADETSLAIRIQSGDAPMQAELAFESEADLLAAMPHIERLLAEADSPASGPLTSAQALALAREGRLVLRVRTETARTAATAIATLARGNAGKPWRVDCDCPEDLALQLASARTQAPVTTASFDQPLVTAMSGEARSKAVHSPGLANAFGATQVPFQVEPPPVTAFVAQVRATPDALDAMRRGVTNAAGGDVRFEVLDQPIELARLEDSLTPTAEDVLWWTLPADAWNGRLAVPLVIEGQ